MSIETRTTAPSETPGEAGSRRVPGNGGVPRRQLLVVGMLVGLAGLQVAPLLLVGGDGWLPRWRSALPEGHDVAFHAIVGHEYLRSVDEGVLVPRWIEPVAGGLGAPVFSYYPPLTYNLARALDGLVAGGSVPALRAAAVAASLLSLITVYILARDRLSILGSLAVATVYSLAASRAIDLHERFALPTHVAYVWLPLIWLMLDRLTRHPGRVTTIVGLAITCAGLVLTHTLSAVLVSYGLGPYVLWRVLRVELSARRALVVSLFAAAVLAGLLSAVLLLPLGLDADLVDSEWIRESPHGQYERNFLWNDEVSRGFTQAVIKPKVEQSAASLALLTVLALVVWWGARRAKSSTSVQVETDDPRVLAILAAWLIFLQTPLSSWLWLWLPGLSWVQFPWRFGSLVTLVVALLAGHAVGALAASVQSSSARLAGLLLLAGGLLVVPVWWDWPTNSLSDADDLTALAPRLIVEEYLPQRLGPHLVEDLARSERVRIVESQGSSEVVTWSSEVRRVKVSLEEPGRMVARTFFHPGWRARVDGEPVELTPYVQDGIALLAVPLGSGDSSVELRYVDTVAGQAGRWISLAGWLLVLVLLGRSVKPRPRASSRKSSSLDVAEGS